MAVSLLAHEVSDLCIGKPPLKSLPITATVGKALIALKLCGESKLGIVSNEKNKKPMIVGKISMSDVLRYLCAQEIITSPAAALDNPVSVLLSKKEAGLVQGVGLNSSILEALDVIVDGNAQSLVVPIPSYISKKKPRHLDIWCWLTHENLVQFFLNNIFYFSPVATLSVAALGLVSPANLSVLYDDPAISALPLIHTAIDGDTALAVVTDDGKLVGEISPSALSVCDETVAAAIASLSAGELMAYIDSCCCGAVTESMLQVVKARLKCQGLDGMLEFTENEELLSSLSASSLSTSPSSSSDEEASVKKQKPRRMRSGSYSARIRKSEEAVVCYPESSLVAVMVQALAHRVSYVWVVDEEDYGLVGIVTFRDVLRVFREQIQ